MAIPYDAAQRSRLQAAAGTAAGADPLQCPACGATLSQQVIEPRAEVPYVRRRLWVLCPACKRSASVDLPPRRSR